MSVETDGEDPKDGPARDTQSQAQTGKPVEDSVDALAHRQDVLEYVSDIALELAALLEREQEAGLANDLRQIADKALKAKYIDPDS